MSGKGIFLILLPVYIYTISMDFQILPAFTHVSTLGLPTRLSPTFVPSIGPTFAPPPLIKLFRLTIILLLSQTVAILTLVRLMWRQNLEAY